MKQVNKNKDSFLKLYRDFLSLVNSSGILTKMKTKVHFISKSKRRHEKHLEAVKRFIKNQKQESSGRSYKKFKQY